MRILLSLFLPVQVQQEQEVVVTMTERMTRRRNVLAREIIRAVEALE